MVLMRDFEVTKTNAVLLFLASHHKPNVSVAFYPQVNLESKIPRVNKVWLIPTVISYIHSFDETGDSAWGKPKAQNFRAEKHLEITWPNQSHILQRKKRESREVNMFAFAGFQMKIIQYEPRLGSEEKTRTQKIRFQWKHSRKEEPRAVC